MPIRIEGQAFLASVRPWLAACDAHALAQSVESSWRPDEVCTLLGDPNVDVRRVAAFTLGLIGDNAVTPCLAQALHDIDPQVNQMAEYGLMSIWFRSGSPAAVKPFREGVALLGADAYAKAIERFEFTTRIDADFAEAYHQCSLAHYSMGAWREALDDCRRTARRLPLHFGAIAGMGHAHLQLGDLPRALQCYKRALEINPRMPVISRTVDRLAARLRRKNDSSGIFEYDGAPA